MAIEVKINNSLQPSSRYITFAPSPCEIRQTPAATPLTVTLSSRAAAAGGGEAVFYASRTVGATPAATLTLTLPANGAWIAFGLGGKQGKPSVNDRDCLLVVTSTAGTITVSLMVRVRKNANTLKTGERDRFLLALAKFNTATGGAPSGYQALRNMHLVIADAEQHNGPHFLPWHRAYLLDLERSLQAIDPSVSMHYWRFDHPAPKVFAKQFMGATAQSATTASLVTFATGNPLNAWITDSTPGIQRSATFNTLTQAAPGIPPSFPLLTQAQTLALGVSYAPFTGMEGSPHGAAHVSFNGSIQSKDTAPRDPLFFMLHANVDRLWALWQFINRRTDVTDANVYVGQNIDGRRVNDTMWPWNGVVAPPRPSFAPGSGMTASPLTSTPGLKPKVGSTIDYHGSRVGMPASWLGFSYDDVPFEFTA